MKRFENKFVITLIAILFALIATCIALVFKYSKYGYLLEIKDFFNFAGSFGGAILGGLVSIVVLKFTLDKQKEQFDEERRIAKERTIIENNIEAYKELYTLCKKMLLEINSLIQEIKNNEDYKNENQYDNLLLYFKKSCDNINILVYDFIFVKLSINEGLFVDINIINLNKKIDQIYRRFKFEDLEKKDLSKTILELERLNRRIKSYVNNIIERTSTLNNRKLLIK
ncbi:TPA: hypothetical protein ACSQWB_000965 [Clostridium perfringens]|uniref:hypothetical protein n=1 Tax=Clostridium perfringens TaxID=1502 RepID=UPI001DDB88E3|nr:hypothetical protein [Clostridium perfringens]EIF5083529.1 hypothetical protein [Clostridium perfringens]